MRKISFCVFVMLVGLATVLVGASTGKAARYLSVAEREELRAGVPNDCQSVVNAGESCSKCLSLANNQYGYCTATTSDQKCIPWTGTSIKMTCEDVAPNPSCGGMLIKTSMPDCSGMVIGMESCTSTWIKKLTDGVPGSCP